MAPTSALPTTFTLRFKNHKSTTFLHADPQQSFDSLREDLLRALKDTHPDGTINGHPLPPKSSHILLARPNDLQNIDKGFTSVTDKVGDIITGNENVGRKKAGQPELKLKEATPKAAGLRDGSVVAYKFRTDLDDDYDPALDEDWDVMMPSYDDQD